MKILIKDKENLKKWGVNLLKFTAPALSVFFYQLSQGVCFKEALPVLVFAIYSLMADYLKKLS